jgi:hypothetical protein
LELLVTEAVTNNLSRSIRWLTLAASCSRLVNVEVQLLNAHTAKLRTVSFTGDVMELGERLGSGDGERKTLLTRQIAFEPLPASVLFALGWWSVDLISPSLE